MVTDYFMDKTNLEQMISKCEIFSRKKEHSYSDYKREINSVKKLINDDISMAWAKLLASKVFYLVYGKPISTFGNFVTIES